QQIERLRRQMDVAALPDEPARLRIEREHRESNLHSTANLQKPWKSPKTPDRPAPHYQSEGSPAGGWLEQTSPRLVQVPRPCPRPRRIPQPRRPDASPAT